MSFFALDLSLQIIRELRPLVVLVRQHDGRLATQITTAASSIALNLGEGNRRQGRDRKHLWRVSAGSAEEVRVAIQVALAWGYFGEPRTQAVMDQLDHVLAMLWKLTR